MLDTKSTWHKKVFLCYYHIEAETLERSVEREREREKEGDREEKRQKEGETKVERYNFLQTICFSSIYI